MKHLQNVEIVCRKFQNSFQESSVFLINLCKYVVSDSKR